MLREATSGDLTALRDLERAANLASLGHVFPPERYPYPDDDVLARWALVLDEPGVRVLVDEHDADLVAFAAYDDRSLRHLAVHPDHWRRGLASTLLAAVVDDLATRGAGQAELWCLEENRRARAFYEHHGWRPTDDRQPAVWSPHPVEMRYVRSLDRSARQPPSRQRGR